MKTYAPFLIYLSLCSIKEKKAKTKQNTITNNTKKKRSQKPPTPPQHQIVCLMGK